MGNILESAFFDNQGTIGGPSNPNTGEGLAAQRSNQIVLRDLAGSLPIQNVSILDGTITPPNGAYLEIDTEGQTPADDLSVINSIRSESDTIHDGMILYVRAKEESRVVTLKNSNGINGIQTVGGLDIVLNTTEWVKLMRTSGSWHEVREKTAQSVQLFGEIKMGTWAFGGSDGKRPLDIVTGAPMEDYVICDGTNGTPNLVGRFIKGRSATASGATGGSSTHAHAISGSVGATVLTSAQMPNHKHETIHTAGIAPWGAGPSTNVRYSLTEAGSTSGSYTSGVGSNQGHTHSYTGSSDSASNEPPYYTLAYIMYIGA